MIKSFFSRLFRSEPVKLAVSETENIVTTSRRYGDIYSRSNLKRSEILDETLKAWRINPVARRITELITQYVVGSGLVWDVSNERSRTYLQKWWNNPLNQMDAQVVEWSDELIRTGDLFLLFSIANNVAVVRPVPSETICEIQTTENDIRQETGYETDTPGEIKWPAYKPAEDQSNFILHFSVNRPAGAKFGEPDLGPILPWLGRYASWLEDRARLNRYRNVWLFILRGNFQSAADRLARQNELNNNPPQPGSILVTDQNEQWGVLSPELASFEAAEDGLALKRMIASGVGIPLHWLAEPEGSTRTTAEAAGTPSFQRLEARQIYFCKIVQQVLETILQIAGVSGKVTVKGADITDRDNAQLSLASLRSSQAFGVLYDRGLIDAREMVRVIYRMSGEPPERTPVPPDNPTPRVPVKSTQPSGTAAEPEEKEPTEEE